MEKANITYMDSEGTTLGSARSSLLPVKGDCVMLGYLAYRVIDRAWTNADSEEDPIVNIMLAPMK